VAGVTDMRRLQFISKLSEHMSCCIVFNYLSTQADSSCGSRIFHAVCMCVFFRTISKLMQLGSSNSTY